MPTAVRMLLLVTCLGAAGPVAGQIPGPDADVTVSDLALDWARGRFASPLICEIDGEPVRGLRRVLITPGPPHARPPVDRIVFVDLRVDEASRCFSELAGDVPNVVGSVQILLPGVGRSDTARRDFREALRRKSGFEFHIPAGGLRVQPVTQPPSAARKVDFRGGRARLHTLDPASDHARLLADLPSPRKLLLELSASDGTKLSFPLALTDLR